MLVTVVKDAFVDETFRKDAFCMYALTIDTLEMHAFTNEALLPLITEFN